jgi:hypothetical protein
MFALAALAIDGYNRQFGKNLNVPCRHSGRADMCKYLSLHPSIFEEF